MEANSRIGGTRCRKLSETEIMILVAIATMYSGLLLSLLGTLMK